MSESTNGGMTRREALGTSGRLLAASALASLAVPNVHAGEDNTIQVALVGCGGRGNGAAVNALKTKSGPIKLVAMADVFKDNLYRSYEHLKKEYPDQVDVPPERQFVDFDGYKKAMDCLRPGDVVIFATPPAFRWVHFNYAIEKGIHVFMEKPTTVDGPTTKKMFELADRSVEKNLKVGVGLMCRHCEARGELFNRIQDGEIGDILFMRAYRMAGPTAHAFAEKKPDDLTELLYQIREFHAFLWASGGAFSDFLIHNIDECCWMKDAWPIEAKASGGRHYRGNYVDQNFDTYSVEYTYADGAKLFLEGRCMTGAQTEFASYAHGSKSAAVISTSGHAPSKCRIFKGHKMDNKEIAWRCNKIEPNPYQLEWDHLITAIREDKPYNEARRGAEASLVTSMGRMAAHTGRVVTYDQILNLDHEFAPDVDKLNFESPAPLICDAEGRYPVPQPGLIIDREYKVIV